MGKKKNRQADVTDDANLHSSESGEDQNSVGSKCPHIARGVCAKKLRKILKKTGINTECETCEKNKLNDSNKIEENDEEGFISMPAPLWICLHCGYQGCGRSQRQHAELHWKTPHSDVHSLTIESNRWLIWCYDCDNEVAVDSRKSLHEIVEFIKKLATTSHKAPQPPIALPPIEAQLLPPPPPPDYNKLATPLTKEKSKHLTNLTRVTGLMNLGNTCFFNSVMQCLAQTPFLVRVLEDLRIPIKSDKRKTESDDTEENKLPLIDGKFDGWGNFTTILHKTIIDMQNSEANETYRPSELLNAFKKKNSQCMDGGQHDSHELLRHLLELIIDEVKKAQSKFHDNKEKVERYLGPETVFRGVLVSTLECIECGHSSQRTEPFLDLSLPVMVEKPQPPVYHKKNNIIDDTNYDRLGNPVTPTPSKHQLKKEKKAARKNRKNRKHSNGNNTNDSLPNDNSMTKECSESIAESEESDADVEDNMEAEENVTAPDNIYHYGGFSNEKDIASSVITAGISNINGNLDDIKSLCINQDNKHLPESDESPTDAIMLDTSPNDYTKSLIDNSMKDQLMSQSSSSNSLNVNCEWSPDRMNVSPLGTPEPSKESPLASMDTKTTFSDAETDECRSSPEVNPNTTENKILNKLNDTDSLLLKLTNDKLDNGIGDITTGLMNVSVSSNKSQTNSCNSQQSSTRYQIRDGDCSIQSCLNQFTQLELMTGNNKVGCEACTAKENKSKEKKMIICTPSTKQYLISKVPPILILHLKRFQSQRFGFRKLSKHVSFPLVLDLAPVCKHYDKPKIYALYGLVEHSGTMHGGHYVAYVKARKPLEPNDPRWSFLPKKRLNEETENNSNSNSNTSTSSSDSETFEINDSTGNVEPPPGRWYYVSDSRVVEIDETNVLQKEAYLLFYERIQ